MGDWTLVVLAAGLGTRFGGPKQLTPIDAAGGTLSDHTLRDARRAGATDAVFVIRSEHIAAFHRHHATHPPGVAIRYAIQPPPAGRSRPWGTVHALLAARAAVSRPFAVVNADDYYGAPALGMLSEFLAGVDPTADEAALVGYRLADTVSPHGGVSRAVVTAGPDGLVTTLAERHGIARQADGTLATTGPDGPRVLPEDATVSMNLWGFTPRVFALLDEAFRTFLREHGASADAECPIPETVGHLCADGRLRLRLLGVAAGWIGITHAADLDAVRVALGDRDPYPAP